MGRVRKERRGGRVLVEAASARTAVRARAFQLPMTDPVAFDLHKHEEPVPSHDLPAWIGWHKDPTGRHEARYFDGRTWTGNVRNGTRSFTDPLETTPLVVMRQGASTRA